jgi:hypothetical protein
MTTTFQPLIGPKDKRVLLLTNMKRNVPEEPIKVTLATENYKEQLTWRDPATGRILAESDFFEPLTINSLTTPGFSGRVYFPTAVGKSFITLQVMPVTKLGCRIWTAVQPKIEHRVTAIGLTENERAANGPLPGDREAGIWPLWR